MPRTPRMVIALTAVKETTFRRARPLVIGMALLLTSCTSSVSRFYPYHVPADSLRMGEVTGVATRDQIANLGTNYEALIASGVAPADLQDGSVAMARVYCCGGPSSCCERGQAVLFLVPAGMTVGLGDLAEIRMGHQPEEDRGRVNTLTKVRQKSENRDPSCRWVPPNPALWKRILYCDWMPQEGWQEQTGIFATWYKPVP